MKEIYKLIKATTLNGDDKYNPTIARMLSCDGYFYNDLKKGDPFIYLYLDGSGKSAISSRVESIIQTNNKLNIKTSNTIYYFEKGEIK